jgi:hypothetical protein
VHLAAPVKAANEDAPAIRFVPLREWASASEYRGMDALSGRRT